METVKQTMISQSGLRSIDIAKVCHQANKAYCESVGDFSQKDWDDVDSELAQTTMECVEQALADPEMTPEKAHENWMESRIRKGWVYGTAKNETLKTHHCIVPYSELPEYQRKKDALFQSIVNALK